MRRVLTMQPGVAGMNKDDEPYLVQKNQSVRAQDAIAQNGALRKIRGWVYEGTVADVADNLVTVGRWEFALADAIRTLTCDDDGDAFIHNAASAGTALFAGTVQYLPRAMYGDQVWWCAQDGVSPVRLYSGAPAGANITYTGTPTITADQSTLTGMTLASNPGSGAYAALDIDPTALGGVAARYRVRLWHRILESSTTSVTLEGIISGVTVGLGASPLCRFEGFGYTFPCVSIYEAGTVVYTEATKNMDGFGTKWSTGATPLRGTQTDGADGVLVTPSAIPPVFFEIETLTDDDDLTVYGGGGGNLAKSPYKVLRRCPFVDVAAHRGSLAGIGGPDSPYPNRVYISPQGWIPALPPGAVPPLNIASVTSTVWGGGSFTDPNDYLLFPVDVPTPFHGDPNVALISSPQGLIIPKIRDAHMIYGDYPNFSQRLWAAGAGCIDRRSAKSYSFGRVWGGQDGFYVEDGGQPRDITEKTRYTGGINGDWRALTDGFTPTDYCCAGEDSGHLKIAMTTDAGALSITYLYDFQNRAWMSEVTRCKARYFFSSKIDGEASKLLWVGDDQQGRVMNSAPALNGTGILKNGDGTSPRFQYDSPYLAEAAGLDGEVLVGDVNVIANVYDLGATGSTKLAVTLEHGGGVRQVVSQEVKALGTIDSDTTDRVDRVDFRANRAGRYIQVKLDNSTVGTNDASTEVEVGELAVELFDTASGT